MGANPWWDWDEEKGTWGWARDAPVSQQRPGGGASGPKAARKRVSEQEKALREFTCGVCKAVLADPLSTPCGERLGGGLRWGSVGFRLFVPAAQVACVAPGWLPTVRLRGGRLPCAGHIIINSHQSHVFFTFFVFSLSFCKPCASTPTTDLPSLLTIFLPPPPRPQLLQALSGQEVQRHRGRGGERPPLPARAQGPEALPHLQGE